MDTVVIQPGKLAGRVTVPPSKSVAHRLLLCAALSQGTSRITNVALSEDIAATLRAVRALGAAAEPCADGHAVTGMGGAGALSDAVIDCNESGSTLRFLIPIALALGGRFTVTGKPRLLERPLDAYFAICDQDGIAYARTPDGITFSGRLRGGDYTLPGNVSSQYVTGLLLALPLLSADSTIHIAGPLESRGYVDLTLEAMAAFGVGVENQAYQTFHIKGGQTYIPRDARVEGDFSQAAFFLVAGALGSDVTVTGLSPQSAQGDRAITDILRVMGAEIAAADGAFAAHARPLAGRRIDVCQIPDLVPVLAVLAAGAAGTTELYNAARLRIKESDRLQTTALELGKLGADITEGHDSLIIHGTGRLSGGVCDAHNDHRIAMALAVASTIADGPVTVTGSACVRKSYANFWADFAMLGGNIHVQ